MSNVGTEKKKKKKTGWKEREIPRTNKKKKKRRTESVYQWRSPLERLSKDHSASSKACISRQFSQPFLDCLPQGAISSLGRQDEFPIAFLSDSFKSPPGCVEGALGLSVKRPTSLNEIFRFLRFYGSLPVVAATDNATVIRTTGIEPVCGKFYGGFVCCWKESCNAEYTSTVFTSRNIDFSYVSSNQSCQFDRLTEQQTIQKSIDRLLLYCKIKWSKL